MNCRWRVTERAHFSVESNPTLAEDPLSRTQNNVWKIWEQRKYGTASCSTVSLRFNRFRCMKSTGYDDRWNRAALVWSGSHGSVNSAGGLWCEISTVWMHHGGCGKLEIKGMGLPMSQVCFLKLGPFGASHSLANFKNWQDLPSLKTVPGSIKARRKSVGAGEYICRQSCSKRRRR